MMTRKLKIQKMQQKMDDILNSIDTLENSKVLNSDKVVKELNSTYKKLENKYLNFKK